MSKEKINFLTKTIPKEYLILKTCEELSELNAVLLQYINKGPAKVSKNDIIEEIGDVKLRIKLIEELFDKKKVKIRFKHKLKMIYKKMKRQYRIEVQEK